MPDTYVVTEGGERELERMRSKIDGLSGPRVSNTPNGIAVGGNRVRNFSDRKLQQPILVTITSTGSNGATWKQLAVASDGSASIMDGGLTDEDAGAAFEVNGNTTATAAGSGTAGAHVWLFFRPADDGTIVPQFQGGPVQVIPVTLTQTGGSLGNKTTASSWTYTVKDIGGATTLLTGASPSVARPNGTLAAATLGIGYYAPNGTGFVLLQAFEITGTGGC